MSRAEITPLTHPGQARPDPSPAGLPGSQTVPPSLIGRAFGLGLFFAALSSDAFAHDFYSGLKRPDGGSCCNGKDCTPVQMCVRDGREGVEIEGACRPIEWSKVLPMLSPDGQAHACHSAGADPIIYCLILPGAA